MDNLYFEMFAKYGPALGTLWPSQLQVLQEALDTYAETGKVQRIEDSYTRFALLMVLCDYRHERKGTRPGTRRRKGEEQKEAR